MLGLSIRLAPLKACDARLVGIGNRGIITVREDQRKERQRSDYLFRPLIQGSHRPTFESAMELARQFQVSVTAALRRIVASDIFPAVVVSYGVRGRRWYERASRVDTSWVPKLDIDGRSRALNVLLQRGKPCTPIKSSASVFFERSDASAFDVTEQFWSPYEGEVLGLFVFGRT